MGELHYLRGPAPAALRDELPPAPKVQPPPSGCTCYANNMSEGPCPMHAPEPTYFIPMPDGQPEHVANPNVCDICRKPRHASTPHHAFEPARASVTWATQLGWPMPPEQEYLL